MVVFQSQVAAPRGIARVWASVLPELVVALREKGATVTLLFRDPTPQSLVDQILATVVPLDGPSDDPSDDPLDDPLGTRVATAPPFDQDRDQLDGDGLALAAICER